MITETMSTPEAWGRCTLTMTYDKRREDLTAEDMDKARAAWHRYIDNNGAYILFCEWLGWSVEKYDNWVRTGVINADD